MHQSKIQHSGGGTGSRSLSQKALHHSCFPHSSGHQGTTEPGPSVGVAVSDELLDEDEESGSRHQIEHQSNCRHSGGGLGSRSLVQKIVHQSCFLHSSGHQIAGGPGVVSGLSGETLDVDDGLGKCHQFLHQPKDQQSGGGAMSSFSSQKGVHQSCFLHTSGHQIAGGPGVGSGEPLDVDGGLGKCHQFLHQPKDQQSGGGIMSSCFPQ
jgi:hypothetical protein